MDALAMDRPVGGAHDLRLEDLQHALEKRMEAIERIVAELRQDWRRMDNRLWALLLLAVGGILTPIVLRTL